MVEIREIAEDELERFVAVRNAVWHQDPRDRRRAEASPAGFIAVGGPLPPERRA